MTVSIGDEEYRMRKLNIRLTIYLPVHFCIVKHAHAVTSIKQSPV
jgi:hypothetical protein